MEISVDIETDTRLIKIPVSVNSQGPFPFNFDTGASTTTLSSNLANQLGIHVYEGDRPNARGLGGGIPTQYAKASVSIGDLKFDEDELYVLDLDRMLRGAGERHGVLGFSTLRHCRVSISYSHKKVRISKDEDEYPESLSASSWTPFEYIKESHLIGIPVIINDQGPFNFVLDTPRIY